MIDGYRAARALALARGLAATVDQRLDWLEEMLEVARDSGALQREIERRRRAQALRWSEGERAEPVRDVGSEAQTPTPPRSD
ncbi:MAG: hypothetical protein AMXMBFR36_02240 [Acidobacteriota bacterium]